MILGIKNAYVNYLLLDTNLQIEPYTANKKNYAILFLITTCTKNNGK